MRETPNIANILAKTLVLASKLTPGGVWAVLAEKVLAELLKESSEQFLIGMDKGHVAIIIPRNGEKYLDKNSEAYKVIEQMGGHDALTQEQKDSIDQPVMDAFIRAFTFRLRKSTKKTS